MKTRTFALIPAAVSVLACAVFICTAWAGGGMPEPAADSLWSYITRTHDYRNWQFYPGYEGMYPGKSPHGAHLKLYANEAAYEAAKNGRSMPDGAILVKENYGKDKETLKAITPMYKSDGYNTEAGDWFWAKLGPDGEAMAAGKVQSCIACHEQMGGGDYVVTEVR
jgi:hypothetical protein